MSVERAARQILFHGMAMMLAGLVWCFVVPATPFPRLGLTAHIQFTSNGVLFIVLAILLATHPHDVGRRSVAFMLLAAWLTWVMLASEVANAWWARNKRCRSLPARRAQQAPQRGKKQPSRSRTSPPDWRSSLPGRC